jgi:RND family efflux transporter MFP subunit
MTRENRVTLGWPALAAGALLVAAAAAGGTYLAVSRGPAEDRPAEAGGEARRDGTSDRMASTSAPGMNGGPSPGVRLTLGEEAFRRASIRTAPVARRAIAATIDLPGVVEANAYAQVAVTPTAAGRVTRVHAALGQSVRRGQPLAELFSPDLAEAQREYISAHADLSAHERELARTTKLVQIGAASRQELERLEAEHVSRQAVVESGRSRLILMGMSDGAVDRLASAGSVGATVAVPAPLTGVVTERLANPGLNVETTSKLFTVADLSTVWVVADVYEKDLGRVRVGDRAVVEAPAGSGTAIEGRVSYIDPQLNLETRTARARIELPNPGERLRFGTFARVRLQGAGGEPALVVPTAAVQTIGARQVVYVAADDGAPRTFVEREVRLGARAAGDVEVLSGLREGDTVVADGSFFLRAERERLGLPDAGGAATGQADGTQAGHGAPGSAASTTREARVTVSEAGFDPARIVMPPGARARLTFTRTSDRTCATDVVVPALGITRPLPLNGPVTVEITVPSSGAVEFTCGMKMFRGSVVAKE